MPPAQSVPPQITPPPPARSGPSNPMMQGEATR
jgi:hypothetical protein